MKRTSQISSTSAALKGGKSNSNVGGVVVGGVSNNFIPPIPQHQHSILRFHNSAIVSQSAVSFTGSSTSIPVETNIASSSSASLSTMMVNANSDEGGGGRAMNSAMISSGLSAGAASVVRTDGRGNDMELIEALFEE